ncbi:hypothetical protein MN116_002892 [Schistosoma mekongi]|uniref:Oxidation resistance protein 1 n=1 Tax=Schistosoma mekongi TaxID=38744 RepID=A0AAE2D710_SCHME|nr:hypothetical protein MN116_002892 [Schistosoma mekongi]
MEASGGIYVYVVKPGDSLSAIAAQLRVVTPTQIARANHLPLTSYGHPPVFPGQRLIIPVAACTCSNSTKIKHLPGVALRVEDMDKQNVITENNAFMAVQPFFYATRVVNSNKSSCSVDDDVFERQFVKVNAHRVLRNHNGLIDGVLLVTPESLCFDASQTAVAQKQAYIASHSKLSSNDDNVNDDSEVNGDKMTGLVRDYSNKLLPSDDNNTEFSCCHIPQELLDLGLCIPLDSIIAMKTLKENDIANISSSECNSEKNSLSNSDSFQNEGVNEHENKQSTDENVKLTSENTGSQLKDFYPSTNNEYSSEVNQLISSINDTGTVGNNEQLKNSEILSKTDTTPSSLSTVSSSPQQLLSTSTETLMNSKKENNDEEKNVTSTVNYLYLRITLIGDVAHIFRLTADHLTQVCSFLLRAGVGSSNDHVEANNPEETVTTENLENRLSEKEQTSDSDSTVRHRRSLVEEMLETIEHSIHVPILYGSESRILSSDMLVDLSKNFPTHWSSSNLNYIYKSEDDGYCLNTVYRKCKDVEGSVLLLIRDTMGVVFGAVMSEGMKCSQHFYGNGETFVFHWKPTFKKYCWTKKNYFFMRGSPHSFHIGGQSGRNAIWFDESLKYGRSEPTDTFDNAVLSGSLPDLQFSSLSVNTQNNVQSIHSNNDESNSNMKFSSNICDSVPFIIDTFELWQLISC